MAIQLLVTDQNLAVQGDPLAGWTDLRCELRFNRPASGSVTLPARPEYMAQLQPGNRLVVIRDGAIWCAGPLEVPQDFEWTAGAGPGTVTAAFSDDLARVAGYVTYPDPAAAFASQATGTDAVRQITTTNAETIIRTLVDENCGPGAIAARQIPSLVLDTVAGVGTSTSISTRFEALLDACRTVASNDGLGFRTHQAGGQIKFGVYAPADRTATARFSAGLGNLRRVAFRYSAPTATSELVQGGNTGSRVYVEATSGDAATWYRVEKLLNQTGTTSAAELTQAGGLAFGEDGAQASLATVTVDTPDLRAGVDFGLGDLVTVELPTGLEVVDLVRAIRLEATPNSGELVTSVVGSSDETSARQTVRVVRQLGRRLGRLEAR